MTIEDLTKCVKAVYERVWGEDRYEFLGSGFAISWGNRTFLVTAGHVIQGKAQSALSVSGHSKPASNGRN